MTIQYDYSRRQRIGMPEAVFCEGKDPAFIKSLIEQLLPQKDHPVLFTRLAPELLTALGNASRHLQYHDLSQTAHIHGPLSKRPGRVAVVSAGTTDLRVATEAMQTLQFTGIDCTLIADVGVAGLWRLMEQIDKIAAHDAVIVVAGMDAALPTVVGGLVSIPVIGVPTSVGYGVATGGTTALHSMLASCAQGVVVCNIDNGFGAACAAVRILPR
jgi:NCAIR mutase (PurE)-related protein